MLLTLTLLLKLKWVKAVLPAVMPLWPVSNPSVTIQSMCTLCMKKGPTLCKAWKEGKQHQLFFHRICYCTFLQKGKRELNLNCQKSQWLGASEGETKFWADPHPLEQQGCRDREELDLEKESSGSLTLGGGRRAEVAVAAYGDWVGVEGIHARATLGQHHCHQLGLIVGADAVVRFNVRWMQ